jgi:hypothetical protein
LQPNWMVVLWEIELFFHSVGIFYPLFIVQCHGFIFLLGVIGY